MKELVLKFYRTKTTDTTTETIVQELTLWVDAESLIASVKGEKTLPADWRIRKVDVIIQE